VYDANMNDTEVQQARRTIPIDGKPSATIGTTAWASTGTRSTDGMPLERVDGLTAREWFPQPLQRYSVVNRLMGFTCSTD